MVRDNYIYISNDEYMVVVTRLSYEDTSDYMHIITTYLFCYKPVILCRLTTLLLPSLL